MPHTAGFAFKGDTWGADEAQATIATNFHGTAAVCEALKGLVPDGGRIVNVCSSAGKLSIIRDAGLRAKWAGAASKAQLSELLAAFVDSIRRGT